VSLVVLLLGAIGVLLPLGVATYLFGSGATPNSLRYGWDWVNYKDALERGKFLLALPIPLWWRLV